MDRQSGGIVALLKLPSLVLWLVFSTVVYGFAAMVVGLFSKRFAQRIGRLWSHHQLFMAGVRLCVNGAERLDRGRNYIFFANHQSALDIPVLYSGIPLPVCFIAKKELFLIPFFGWSIWAMGHIRIDRASARKARDSLTRGIMHLKKHRLSLILFPEGTRSTDGRLGEFKQGSFALAFDAGVPIVPVAIRKANECLAKKSLQVKAGTVFLDICDPIDPAGMGKREMAAVVRGEIEKRLEAQSAV